MIALLTRIVGPKLARPVAFGLLAALVLLMIFVVVRCQPRDTTAQQQAQQTTRSSDAIADAASGAIATIENRTITDADIDAATDAAVEDIANAQDPVAVRSAVLDRVCRQASHRNDPACAVR